MTELSHGSTPHPRTSLGRVLDGLGVTLLDVVHGSADAAVEVGGVAIHDPGDVPDLPTGSIVLGVGVTEASAVVELLEELGRSKAAALVLRAPISLTPEIRAAADAGGVTLLALSRGVPWAHLTAMLRSLLAEGDIGVAEPESLGGLPSGDLFAVANAIASLLDAPITIEDLNSRVLAFSGRQDEADQERIDTILGRQVPEHIARAVNDRGFFRELHRTGGPIYMEALSLSPDRYTMPRVAVAVRAGDQTLGSIWAAVSEPLSTDRMEAFREAAKLVALHLMRVRAGADVTRRLRTDLVSSAMEGGTSAGAAIERLGLAGRHLVVLALALRGTKAPLPATDVAAGTQELERLSDAFALHLGAVEPQSATAAVGGVTYALVPVRSANPDEELRVLRVAADFLHRVGNRHYPVIGIGPVTRELGELTRAKLSADRALRVLQDSIGDVRVARLADVQAQAMILEMRDLSIARGDSPAGPVLRLLDYDRKHHSSLVQTLRAWLEAFGDVAAASSSVHVHTNTFRYRLRRVAEVAQIDLADPDARFGLELQLRIFDHRRR